MYSNSFKNKYLFIQFLFQFNLHASSPHGHNYAKKLFTSKLCSTRVEHRFCRGQIFSSLLSTIHHTHDFLIALGLGFGTFSLGHVCIKWCLFASGYNQLQPSTSTIVTFIVTSVSCDINILYWPEHLLYCNLSRACCNRLEYQINETTN